MSLYLSHEHERTIRERRMTAGGAGDTGDPDEARAGEVTSTDGEAPDGGNGSGARPGGGGNGGRVAGRRRRAGGLHQPERVAVVWDKRRRQPSAFIWRGRRFTVSRLVELWVIETGWWSDESHVSRSYCRVEAAGRLFDLFYDRLTHSWSLERALN